MKAIRLLIALLLTAPLAQLAGAAEPVLPKIANLISVQRPGTFFVDVTYDLIDSDSPGGIYILAEASADNGATYGISMKSLSGDFGLVKPGLGKRIVWNAWQDWARNYTTNARVRLIADDILSTIGTTNVENYTTNVPPNTNLVWVPSGAFNMSGTDVYISKSFWMGKFEVTQSEYQNIMSNNPSYFTGNPNRPVEKVTWYDAFNYCEKLTTLEQAAGRIQTNWTYRLPTEAEWEYACRAGTTTTYSFGEDPSGNRLHMYAWHTMNSGNQAHEVGTRAPNRWGLYDMHGNVREWCQDWIRILPGGSVTDPVGPSWSARGGHWGDYAYSCKSAYRAGEMPPKTSDYTLGFRIVLAPVH